MRRERAWNWIISDHSQRLKVRDKDCDSENQGGELIQWIYDFIDIRWGWRKENLFYPSNDDKEISHSPFNEKKFLIIEQLELS